MRIVKWYDKIKPYVSQDFSNVRSVCDQRAILNNPQELYEQYVVNEEMHEELLEEELQDFDDDFYEYEERAEYGVDVAAASAIAPDALSIKSKRDRAKKNE